MTLSEFTPVGAALVAIIAAGSAFYQNYQNRKKPILDEAQAEAVSAQVKKTNAEINRDRDEYNARRDLELIRWQSWVFEKVRPWGRDVVTKFDQQGEQLRQALAAIARMVTEAHLEPFDEIHLDPFPEMPPPLPSE